MSALIELAGQGRGTQIEVNGKRRGTLVELAGKGCGALVELAGKGRGALSTASECAGQLPGRRRAFVELVGKAGRCAGRAGRRGSPCAASSWLARLAVRCSSWLAKAPVRCSSWVARLSVLSSMAERQSARCAGRAGWPGPGALVDGRGERAGAFLELGVERLGACRRGCRPAPASGRGWLRSDRGYGRPGVSLRLLAWVWMAPVDFAGAAAQHLVELLGAAVQRFGDDFGMAFERVGDFALAIAQRSR